MERISKFEHVALVRADLAAVHRSLADDAALPLMIQGARDEVYTSLYALSVTDGVVGYRDYLSRRSSERALTAIDDMQLAAASFEDLINRFILAHTNVREQLKSIMSRTPSITSVFNPVDGELAVERAVQEVFLGHIVRIEQLLGPVAASFRQVIESLASVEKSHKSLAADLGIDWSDLKSAAAATRAVKEGSAWRYLFNSLREGFSDRPAPHRQFAEFDGLVDQASIKAQSALTAITNMRDEIAMIRDFALRTDGHPGFDPVWRETASSIEPTIAKLDASIMYMALERAEAQALQQRRVREFNRKQKSK